MAEESVNRPVVIFVLGGPGSGKGTQCERISSTFNFKHISAGDCLREERQSKDSKYGDLIEDCITSGKIVPVEITCALLVNKMKFHGWDGGKFLIDGFPRNEDNLQGWLKEVGDKVDLRFCLCLQCPQEEMERRLLGRGQHSGRTDDNITSIRKRFKTYTEDTLPIIKWFASKGICKEVDGTDSIDNVWKEVQSVFEDFKEKSKGDDIV